MIQLKLSVHEIIDFLLRKGDIDNRVFNTSSMLEGTKIHKYYQLRQGNDYKSEVSLSTNIYLDNYKFSIYGRADGISTSGTPTIDEIKTANIDLETFYLQYNEWHLGQAEFYAYMYAKHNSLDIINISLTYLSQTKKNTLKKYFSYSITDLENKIFGYLRSYISYKAIFERRRDLRNKSLDRLCFPYKTIRRGQSELIDATKYSINNHDTYFIEASTGIGKTISTLYGALDSVKNNDIDKIFYLTAKNSGFVNCLKAMNDLKKKDMNFVTTQISAREKMCLNRKKIGKCNPEDCPYTRDYFTKIKDIIVESIDKYDIFDNKRIISIGKENMVCPFELSLDLSLFSDVILCDYNYVFSPIAMLQRYFETPDKQYNMVLLVDEAHNLISRSRDMYSSILSVNTFMKAKPDLDNIKLKSLKNRIQNISSYFNELKDFDFGSEINVPVETFNMDFIDQITKFDKEIKTYKNKHKRFKSDTVDILTREIYKFIVINDYYKANPDKYSLYVTKTFDDVVLNTFCLDSSQYINDMVYKFKGSVCFSATLSPLNYYKKILFGRDNFKDLIIPSPFPKENFKLLVNNSVSLLYKDRNKSIGEITDEIDTFVKGKTGNYIVFCPSFEYLDMLEKSYLKSNFNCIFQKRFMDFSEKENFLNSFKENPNETFVGFCVLGGIFSEGIDLVGSRLIGTVVIGIGLPMLSFENNLLKKYYDSIGLNGFEYAYSNVGVNKVMQAVGRLIRTPQDKGAVLLLDYRYSYKNFKELFENSWSNNSIIKNCEDIKNCLESFYNN